jgi:hypothetical protein
LGQYAEHVIVVPKDPAFEVRIDELIPREFIIGFSVPTRYGATPLAANTIGRPVHLLGGRPDVQRRLAEELMVISLDCNRFTLDAAFGDYFDGLRFRPHPIGGYNKCLEESIANITKLWSEYAAAKGGPPNETYGYYRQNCRDLFRRLVSGTLLVQE